jgi:hypothetical protein
MKDVKQEQYKKMTTHDCLLQGLEMPLLLPCNWLEVPSFTCNMLRTAKVSLILHEIK